MLSLPGFKLLKEFGPDEPIVAMTQYKDFILVATSKRVFKATNDLITQFEPVEFVEREETPASETP